jgi:hypothetical protein
MTKNLTSTKSRAESVAAATPKSAGQLAYELDVVLDPNYHDGSPRKKWEELDDISRWSWERNPTPRAARGEQR